VKIDRSILIQMLRPLVEKMPHRTSDSLRQLVLQTVPPLMGEANVNDTEWIIKQLEVLFDVEMDLGISIQEPFTPWLENQRSEIDFFYWNRYKDYLSRLNFGPRVISTINQDTERLLGLLENPIKEGMWGRMGMVVGHVQSGKTANYTGLICKAADAGYRLIIVIAGIHNNLRSQTQERIDLGFVGKDSGKTLSDQGNYIGVGSIDNKRIPMTLTSRVSDFNIGTTRKIGFRIKDHKEPVVLVIKKNTSTLTNLIKWLKEYNTSYSDKISDLPMLLIDDEADNASINTSNDPERATRINGLIREVLNLFDKQSYVGYTATPFANIFIDPETDDQMLGQDLFPRNFIYSLEAPSNYFGAEQFFACPEEHSPVRKIDDFQDTLPVKHHKEMEVHELPETLLHAIRTYVLAGAIRILRDEQKFHHSMLVNVSRFTNIQEQVKDTIFQYLDTLSNHISYNYKQSPELACQNWGIAEMRNSWEDEFSHLEFSWENVQAVLYKAISPVKVLSVNSLTKDRLDYRDYETQGLFAITVGGFSLSRGLTLEGLCVSYFLRNSMMYDTLMQMGRWFGYRHGYEDLCRLYMTEQASGWYAHITETLLELRHELSIMEKSGLTPEQFGLKVRSHPDSLLIVTARGKMRTSRKITRAIDLSGRLIEAHRLWDDDVEVQSNFNLLDNLLNQLGDNTSAEKIGSNFFWPQVPASSVKSFISNFRNHPAAPLTQAGPLLDYIEEREDGELSDWDIVLIGVTGKQSRLKKVGAFNVGVQQRSAGTKQQQIPKLIHVGDRSRVAARGIEKLGLDQEQILQIEQKYREDNNTKNIPDLAYRIQRKRPLLMLHILDIFTKDEKATKQLQELKRANLVTYGISFPFSKVATRPVQYEVNTTYWNDVYNLEEEDEEEEVESDLF
jgi:hypothetical protein